MDGMPLPLSSSNRRTLADMNQEPSHRHVSRPLAPPENRS